MLDPDSGSPASRRVFTMIGPLTKARASTRIVLQAHGSLEPQVAYAATVVRQIAERIQPIEVIDRESRHGFRRCQPDVHSHPTATVFLEAQSPPAKHSAARRAEVNFQRRICFARAGVAGARARDMDALTFVVIRPQRAVLATECAVAGGDAAWITFQGPAQSAAVAGSFSMAPSCPRRGSDLSGDRERHRKRTRRIGSSRRQ